MISSPRGGDSGRFIDGSEYWPKRVTASGYIFLENLSESQNDDGKLLRLLKTFGVRAAQELGKESLDQAIFALPRFLWLAGILLDDDPVLQPSLLR